MIVTIVTFQLPKPATLGEITKTFQATAPKYQGMTGLLRKNYWMSEDGRRAGGIYVWAFARGRRPRLYGGMEEIRRRQVRLTTAHRIPAFAGDGRQPRGHDQRRGLTAWSRGIRSGFGRLALGIVGGDLGRLGQQRGIFLGRRAWRRTAPRRPPATGGSRVPPGSRCAARRAAYECRCRDIAAARRRCAA